MTKRDWIWITIRIFGIYLLVQAVIAIPNLISSTFGLYQLYPVVHSGSADMDRISQTLRSSFGSEFVNALARLLIYSAVGIYFVRGGSCLFKILCPPD
jgi:hypothetical protein